MRSRCMSLLPRTTLHSDSEHVVLAICFLYLTVLNSTKQTLLHIDRVLKKTGKQFQRSEKEGKRHLNKTMSPAPKKYTT
jgi:hypothetical protein